MVINLFRRLQLDRNEIIIPQRLLINFKLLLSFDLPASTFFHRSRHLPIPSRGLEGPLNKQFPLSRCFWPRCRIQISSLSLSLFILSFSFPIAFPQSRCVTCIAADCEQDFTRRRRIAATMKKPWPRKYARYAIKFNDSSLRTVSLYIGPWMASFVEARGRVAGVESVVNRSIEMAAISYIWVDKFRLACG